MTQPYSEDLRERALARSDAGEADRSIAEALQIAPSCLSKGRKLRRETGELKPGKMNGHKRRTLSGEIAQWLRERTQSAPFPTRQLTAELVVRGIKTDRRAVWTFLHSEGLSFKRTIVPTEQDRPDVARLRQRWKAHQDRNENASAIHKPLALIAAIAAFGGVAPAKEATSICSSPKRSFSTICPPGWNRVDEAGDSISIISFPRSQREEGVVIKDGGAQIIVSKNKLDGASPAQWMKKDNQGTRTLNRTLKGKSLRKHSCSTTAYLEVEIYQGEPPSEIDSQIYCFSEKDVYKFQLRRWADGRKAAAYKAVLASMFDNLKVH